MGFFFGHPSVLNAKYFLQILETNQVALIFHANYNIVIIYLEFHLKLLIYLGNPPSLKRLLSFSSRYSIVVAHQKERFSRRYFGIQMIFLLKVSQDL